MKKKTYIVPAVLVYQMHTTDGILVTLSGSAYSGDPADEEFGMDSKGSGDWDIWGNGDGDDDYDY